MAQAKGKQAVKPATQAPATNVTANTQAPLPNGLTALVQQAQNFTANTVKPLVAATPQQVAAAQAVAPALTQAGNAGSFWRVHAAQAGKPLAAQYANGVVLGKLSAGPRGVPGKGDFLLSQAVCAIAVNGMVTALQLQSIGVANHNLNAWVKRGWVTLPVA
jgi:hypothetical protein